MDDQGVTSLVARLKSLPPVPSVAKLQASDVREACLAGLLVLLATLPVAVPFLLIGEVERALRVSNGVAVAMLFVSGVSLARASGLRPWVLGGLMVVLGVVLVGITIALGGGRAVVSPRAFSPGATVLPAPGRTLAGIAAMPLAHDGEE